MDPVFRRFRRSQDVPPDSGRTHPHGPSRGRHQLAARHPQVRQRKQRRELGRVLLQSPVAHLHETELALGHPKRVLHPGADAGLEVFDFVDQRIDRVGFVQLLMQARTHGDAPGDVALGIGPLSTPW